MKRKLSNKGNDNFNNKLISIAQVNPWMYDKKSSIDDATKETLWSEIRDDLRERGIKVDSKYLYNFQLAMV